MIKIFASLINVVRYACLEVAKTKNSPAILSNIQLPCRFDVRYFRAPNHRLDKEKGSDISKPEEANSVESQREKIKKLKIISTKQEEADSVESQQKQIKQLKNRQSELSQSNDPQKSKTTPENTSTTQGIHSKLQDTSTKSEDAHSVESQQKKIKKIQDSYIKLSQSGHCKEYKATPENTSTKDISTRDTTTKPEDAHSVESQRKKIKELKIHQHSSTKSQGISCTPKNIHSDSQNKPPDSLNAKNSDSTSEKPDPHNLRKVQDPCAETTNDKTSTPSKPPDRNNKPTQIQGVISKIISTIKSKLTGLTKPSKGVRPTVKKTNIFTKIKAVIKKFIPGKKASKQKGDKPSAELKAADDSDPKTPGKGSGLDLAGIISKIKQKIESLISKQSKKPGDDPKAKSASLNLAEIISKIKHKIQSLFPSKDKKDAAKPSSPPLNPREQIANIQKQIKQIIDKKKIDIPKTTDSAKESFEQALKRVQSQINQLTKKEEGTDGPPSDLKSGLEKIEKQIQDLRKTSSTTPSKENEETGKKKPGNLPNPEEILASVQKKLEEIKNKLPITKPAADENKHLQSPSGTPKTTKEKVAKPSSPPLNPREQIANIQKQIKQIIDNKKIDIPKTTDSAKETFEQALKRVQSQINQLTKKEEATGGPPSDLKLGLEKIQKQIQDLIKKKKPGNFPNPEEILASIQKKLEGIKNKLPITKPAADENKHLQSPSDIPKIIKEKVIKPSSPSLNPREQIANIQKQIQQIIDTKKINIPKTTDSAKETFEQALKRVQSQINQLTKKEEGAGSPPSDLKSGLEKIQKKIQDLIKTSSTTPSKENEETGKERPGSFPNPEEILGSVQKKLEEIKNKLPITKPAADEDKHLQSPSGTPKTTKEKVAKPSSPPLNSREQIANIQKQIKQIIDSKKIDIPKTTDSAKETFEQALKRVQSQINQLTKKEEGTSDLKSGLEKIEKQIQDLTKTSSTTPSKENEETGKKKSGNFPNPEEILASIQKKLEKIKNKLPITKPATDENKHLQSPSDTPKTIKERVGSKIHELLNKVKSKIQAKIFPPSEKKKDEEKDKKEDKPKANDPSSDKDDKPLKFEAMFKKLSSVIKLIKGRFRKNDPPVIIRKKLTFKGCMVNKGGTGDPCKDLEPGLAIGKRKVNVEGLRGLLNMLKMRIQRMGFVARKAKKKKGGCLPLTFPVLIQCQLERSREDFIMEDGFIGWNIVNVEASFEYLKVQCDLLNNFGSWSEFNWPSFDFNSPNYDLNLPHYDDNLPNHDFNFQNNDFPESELDFHDSNFCSSNIGVFLPSLFELVGGKSEYLKVDSYLNIQKRFWQNLGNYIEPTCDGLIRKSYE